VNELKISLSPLRLDIFFALCLAQSCNRDPSTVATILRSGDQVWMCVKASSEIVTGFGDAKGAIGDMQIESGVCGYAAENRVLIKHCSIS
jgi:hypothetical protein